jgi:hypothetical protein
MLLWTGPELSKCTLTDEETVHVVSVLYASCLDALCVIGGLFISADGTRRIIPDHWLIQVDFFMAAFPAPQLLILHG